MTDFTKLSTERAPATKWPEPLRLKTSRKGKAVNVAIMLLGVACLAGGAVAFAAPWLWAADYATAADRRGAWGTAGALAVLGIFFLLAAYDAMSHVVTVEGNVLKVGGRLSGKSVPLHKVAAWSAGEVKVKHVVPVGTNLLLHDAEGNILAHMDMGLEGIGVLKDFLARAYPEVETLRSELLAKRTLAAAQEAASRGEAPPPLGLIRAMEGAGGILLVAASGALVVKSAFDLDAAWAPAAPAMTVGFALGFCLCIAPFVIFRGPVSAFDPTRLSAASGPLTLACIFGWCASLLGATFLRPWPLIGLGMAVGLIPAVLMGSRARLSPKPAARVIQIGLILLTPASLPLHVNRAFDRSEPKPTETRVTRKLKPSTDKAGQDHYTIEFENPLSIGSSKQLSMSRARYESIQVGDTIALPVMAGALESPWVPDLDD